MNFLRRLWEGWKRVAHWIGNVQARILLTIIYGLVVLPFGVIVRLFADPIRIKRPPQQWLDHAEDRFDLEWARKQW